ncbi:unnamed protein product, partial [Sphagnum jensenii]
GAIINFGCNLDGQQQADVGGINTRASRGHHGFYSNQAMSIAGHSAQLDSSQKQDRNNVVSAVHGASFPYLSSSATIAAESHDNTMKVLSGAHHTVVTQNKTSNARTLGPALNTNLKPRARQGSANDPQSIAARVRRERISDRLKALQLLIPNGDKVDMVTMLEKAINYVQCLELQIRMLKDDALWPKALGVLPNTLQELLELAGPEFAALREEEVQKKKKEKSKHINKEDPLSSPAPSSNNTE